MSYDPTPQLIPCAVTGKLVPEDELVTINGQRVCAEGKAILLAQLKAGEVMPGEFEKPGVLRRIGCIMLDGLILAVIGGLVGAAIGAVFGATFGGLNSTNTIVLTGLVTVVTAGIQILYFGAMHASSGQTVGKKAGKIIVVNSDGSPISSSTAYFRAFLYPGIQILQGLAGLTGIGVIVLPVQAVVGLWLLADAIAALTDGEQQRTLHDRIAGTRVVMKQ